MQLLTELNWSNSWHRDLRKRPVQLGKLIIKLLTIQTSYWLKN